MIRARSARVIYFRKVIDMLCRRDCLGALVPRTDVYFCTRTGGVRHLSELIWPFCLGNVPAVAGVVGGSIENGARRQREEQRLHDTQR